MKNRKLQTHATAAEAYSATKQNGIIAVVVKTHTASKKDEAAFYSYESNCENQSELHEDFPRQLRTSQSIEFVEQDGL